MRNCSSLLAQPKMRMQAITLLSLCFLVPVNTWAQDETLDTTVGIDATAEGTEKPGSNSLADDDSRDTTSTEETLSRLVLNDGQYVLTAGLIFPTVQELPSTMRNFCDDGFLLDCDVGPRVSFEKRTRPISGASAFGFTGITLDGVDNMTTLLYSKGVGVGVDALQLVGLNAQVSVGLGMTHLRVNGDKAFTPTADVDVSVSFNLSRFVYRFGGYYRDMLDADIDGINYGTPVKSLYFSVGLSL